MNTQEAYKQKFEAKLKEADAEISRMKARAEGAQADTKLKIEEQLNALRNKRESFKSKLEDVQEKGTDAATEIVSGLEKAWDDLSTSLSSAKQKLQ